MTDSGTPDLLPVLYQRARTVAVVSGDLPLLQAINAYLTSKRRRLTEASERGYRACLLQLLAAYPHARICDFEPPYGATLIEDFLAARWSDRAPRTYNKQFSVCHDFFEWFVARGVLDRDPMATLERAKARPIRRRTFSEDQCAQILAANPQPREQLALRLLLYYALRKGALRRVRFEHFDRERRQLTIFTKGGKVQILDVVDGDTWKLLDQVGGEPDHYLLPKRRTRRRTPPRRKQLNALHALLREAREKIAQAADDPVCARELALLLAAVEESQRWLKLATDAASTRTVLFHNEEMAEHGAHLWWYRCLARAGIVNKGVTAGRRMHDSRHTAIQRVLDKTGNLKAAQSLAGHATVATTGDVYSGWDGNRLADTMREVLGQ